jgi:hypothetical protein
MHSHLLMLIISLPGSCLDIRFNVGTFLSFGTIGLLNHFILGYRTIGPLTLENYLTIDSMTMRNPIVGLSISGTRTNYRIQLCLSLIMLKRRFIQPFSRQLYVCYYRQINKGATAKKNFNRNYKYFLEKMIKTSYLFYFFH